MTKEQERQALKKVEKILDDLGEESYVAKAFEGCAVIAKDNIDNDFFCSMQDIAKTAERQAVAFGKKWTASEKAVAEQGKEIAALRNEAKEATDDRDYWNKKYHELWDAFTSERKQANEYKATIIEQERIITELKAKLYDLITK